VSILGHVIAAVRPHHWAKNVLVIAPIVLAHRWGDTILWARACLCFAAFSCAASGVYVVNDVLDMAADRKHPSKRMRPVASGALSRSAAVWLAVLLFTVAASCCAALPSGAAVVVGVYVIAAILYSAWLKAVAVVDVLLLGGFYALRVIAGGAATEIAISPWTLAFSMFLFLSLALAKRYVEVRRHGPSERRGYRQDDARVLLALGVGTGLLAVQVLALYIYSPEVRQLYARPELLWLICPVLLGWIARLWLVAGRGELHDDPLLFALHDAGSYATAAVTGIILMLATFSAA
jgi:4-hydroxybenzoate polyprenyltransferase